MRHVMDRRSGELRRLDALTFLIAHCARTRGWCPRLVVRVLYQDMMAGSGSKRNGDGASIGSTSSHYLAADLRHLQKHGVIRREDCRLVVLDWAELNRMARYELERYHTALDQALALSTSLDDATPPASNVLIYDPPQDFSWTPATNSG